METKEHQESASKEIFWFTKFMSNYLDEPLETFVEDFFLDERRIFEKVKKPYTQTLDKINAIRQGYLEEIDKHISIQRQDMRLQRIDFKYLLTFCEDAMNDALEDNTERGMKKLEDIIKLYLFIDHYTNIMNDRKAIQDRLYGLLKSDETELSITKHNERDNILQSQLEMLRTYLRAIIKIEKKSRHTKP